MAGFAWSAIARCSMTITYKRGLSGHPWRVPLDIGKEEREQFTQILADGAEYKAWILCNKVGPSRHWVKVCCRNAQLTWSNAFSASIPRTDEIYVLVGTR